MLKDLNNDQVFAIELTEALIEYVWEYYAKQIKDSIKPIPEAAKPYL